MEKDQFLELLHEQQSSGLSIKAYWEEAPVLWDAVRFAVDMRGEVGQFILTGGQYAYRREDGVYVVPIGCLRP